MIIPSLISIFGGKTLVNGSICYILHVKKKGIEGIFFFDN